MTGEKECPKCKNRMFKIQEHNRFFLKCESCHHEIEQNNLFPQEADDMTKTKIFQNIINNNTNGDLNNQTIKLLADAVENALPDCRAKLIIDKTENDKESIVGELAHIKGESPGSARYDTSMNDEHRNSSDNLLLVCAVCHKRIDDQQNTFTVDKLMSLKKEHREWVIVSTKQAIVNITFKELREITQHLLSNQIDLDSSYTLITPKDKIKKNNLSNQIEGLITMGMTQVKRVRDFISANPDIEFGERLKQGFVIEYTRLKNEEKLNSDELFNRLLDFASGGSNDFNVRAGGLAVLTYLFEKCEVFEK